MSEKIIKVLVVDDSIVYREMLSKGISSEPDIKVVATAKDPYDASRKITEHEPDVMILDVEMPKMNGIEFLKRLMPQYPMPVIVVSSISEYIFDALAVGAIDFVAKPSINTGMDVDKYMNELILKIRMASTSKVSPFKSGHYEIKDGVKPHRKKKLIAIGASTGGTEAIYAILKSLSIDLPGIVVAQHMPPVFTKMYAQRLNSSLALDVREAKTGDVIRQGSVLIAPGDHHMRVRKIGSIYKVECFKGEKVNGHCPSVDVLFESVAQEAGRDAIGIILTGMGYDGAKGLLSMRKKGANTVGQDERSCVVYGMPKVAFNMGAVEKQASIENIPQSIYSLL